MKQNELAAAVDQRIAMAATLLALSKQQDEYPLLLESVNDSALFQLSMALRHFIDESFLVFIRPLVNWHKHSLTDVLNQSDIAPLIELKQLEQQKGSWVSVLVKHSIISLFDTTKDVPTLIASDAACLIKPSDIIVSFRAFLEAQRESMIEY